MPGETVRTVGSFRLLYTMSRGPEALSERLTARFARRTAGLHGADVFQMAIFGSVLLLAQSKGFALLRLDREAEAGKSFQHLVAAAARVILL
jgi:hypothetical protein